MSDKHEFREQVQRIGEQLRELENIVDPSLRAKVKELVRLLMELHGSAIERAMEIVFQTGNEGARIIDELGEDPLVSSLLILYGLHPEDLQARIERKLVQIRSQLFKLGAEAKVIAVNGSDVRVGVKLDGRTCGSTVQNVKAAVEDAVYEAAPDLTSLVIEGLEAASAVGFVAIDSLSQVARDTSRSGWNGER